MDGHTITRSNRRDLLIVALAVKLASLLCIFAGYSILPRADYGQDIWMTRPDTTFSQNLANFDGAWFIRIAALGNQRLARGDYDLKAETGRLGVMDPLGYQQALWPKPEGDIRIDRGYGWRHWPGMVWAIKAVRLPVRDYLAAGLITANLCHILYMILLYGLVRMDFNHRTGILAMLFASIHPGAYSMSAVYNESMFLMFAVGAIYCARKEMWLLAGLAGMAAAMTRIFGIVLLAPLLYEYLRTTYDKKPGPAPIGKVMQPANLARALTRIKEDPQVLALILVPMGTAIVLLYFQYIAGDPWIWTRVHETNVHGSLGWPWQMLIQTYQKGPHVWMKELPLHAALLVVILASLSRYRRSYLMWMALFFLYHTSNGNHSYLRYQIQCAPMFIVLADLSDRHPVLRYILVPLSAIFAVTFAALYINGYWVA